MTSDRWVDASVREAIILLSLLPRFNAKKLKLLRSRLTQPFNKIQSFDHHSLIALGFSQEQIEFLRNHAKTKTFQQAIDWHQPTQNQFILTIDDESYPSLLREIPRPPLVLFLKGNVHCINDAQFAIVGSRNPTTSGIQIARQFAKQLAALGLTVTSGLAMGIDACAHQGAIDGKGKTLAVLGCGIDLVYPKRNSRLYASIIASEGLLVSEFLPGTPAVASHFPRRNRIVSGLSLGTVVVEAALKSGSLITARAALEQNRDVFAVPGNLLNPNAAGCNYLVQQGAKLVTKIEDILEEYQHLIYTPQRATENSPKKSGTSHLASDRLLDSVDDDVTAIDVIAERNKLPVHAVMAALLEYELRGFVVSVPGGYVKLRGK